MKYTVDEKIQMYRDIYFRHNGEYPNIEKTGAWLRVNGEEKSIRAKDLVNRTWYILKLMEKKKQESWSQYIGQDIIDMFLNRLFFACHSSPHEMETCLKDFALSGEVTKGLDALWTDNHNGEPKRCEEDECRMLDNLEEQVFSLRDDLEKAHKAKRLAKENMRLAKENMGDVEADNRALKEGMDQLKREMDKLRSESVLFSMGDLETEGYINKQHKPNHWDDDDIPF